LRGKTGPVSGFRFVIVFNGQIMPGLCLREASATVVECLAFAESNRLLNCWQAADDAAK
jgi:hypothetical protein